MKDLEKLRKKIDEIDEKILEAIASRTALVYKVARLKARKNLLILDEKREKKVFTNIQKIARENHISDEFAEEIYKLIIEYCRGIQKLKN